MPGVSAPGIRGRGQAARRPSRQNRGRDSGHGRNRVIVGSDHLHIGGGDGIHIQVQQPVVLFGVGSPLIPAQAKIDGQAVVDLPTVLEVGPELLLAEVEIAAVVLVAEIGRQTEFQISKSVSGVGHLRLSDGIVQSSPVIVEGVAPLSLLHLADVVLFRAPAKAELHGVLALDPGDVVVELVLGQLLILRVAGVPAAVIHELRVAGVDSRPSGGAERIRQTELVRPVCAVG